MVVDVSVSTAAHIPLMVYGLVCTNNAAQALAVALTGLINTLNLPLYLLGGGVCEASNLFSPHMFAELES